MADPLSPIASVVSLISAAVGLVQEVRKARNHVKGARMTLERVSSVLNHVTEDLDSVKSNPVLQTPEIKGIIKETKTVLENLAQFFANLEAKEQRGSVTKILVAMKTGDADEDALKQILGDLDSARDRLHMQISICTNAMTQQVNEVANMSLLDIQETKNTSKDTNTLVRNGFQSVFEKMASLNNESQLTGRRTIRYSTSEMVFEKVDNPSEASNSSTEIRDEPSQHGADNLTWLNNRALETRVVAGNVGFEDNSKVSTVNSTVRDSTFEKSHYVGGHVAGSAANDFWKN